MAKIALVIVLISMIMILSIHSAVGDAAVSSTPATGAADAKGAAVPAADGPSKGNKDSTWTDWAKQKISGIENMFSSSSSSASAPAPAPIPATATTTPAATTTTPSAGKV
ncbi:hypothetical protein V6N13_049248 [Hibiscus sabdariffa]|uniref:Uncharacterized protein n=2 Tax=Hibiscus sabdariffa TaxID=183260 RepID=A0ABR1ZNF3_9ROSI